MRINMRNLTASVAFVSLITTSTLALGFETTSFSVSLSDTSKTGPISIGESQLGNGTSSISAGSNVYNTAFQYFTPLTSGTYVFGQLSAPVDTVILLYSPTFQTSDPATNFVTMNDDGDTSGIADSSLQTYTDNAISSRNCSTPGLCPLLVANLTSGVNYYVVVSTYSPGDSLGTGDLVFFVIGDQLVGVGGVAPGNYVSTAAPTPLTGLATYLDGFDNSGDLATVATYLNTLSAEQVADALKEIFPVNTSVGALVSNNATGQTSTVLLDKVGTVLGNVSSPAASMTGGNYDAGKWVFGSEANKRDIAPTMLGYLQDTVGTTNSSDDLLASLASTPYSKYTSGTRAFWVQGVGGITNGGATDSTLGYDATSYGLVSGYEMATGENSLVGLIASMFRSNIDTDNNAGSTDASTYSAGIYGQRLLGTAKLTGIMLASYSNYDNKRFVDLGGITGTPKASYSGWGTSTTLGISKLLQHNGIKLEPFANVNYSTASTGSYTEKNGGVYNMSVDSDFSSTAAVKGGITVQYDSTIGSYDMSMKVKPYVGYQWELNEASSAVRLVGAGSSTVINGRSNQTPQIGLGLETSVNITETNSFKVGIDISHDRNENRGLAYVGYGVKF